MKFLPTLIFSLTVNLIFGQILELSPVSDQLEGIIRGACEFADADGDSDQDLFLTGRDINGDRFTQLYINDGAGNFTPDAQTNWEQVDLSSLAFADIDSDNDLDVIYSGRNSVNIAVTKLYRNNGDGGFSEVEANITGVYFSTTNFADVDNDGDEDLIISGTSDNQGRITKLYLNDGTGNFSEPAFNPFTGVSYAAADLGDVDNDGDLDILIAGENNNGLRITGLYLNDGLGNFSLNTDSDFAGTYFGSVHFADIDGDDDLDVFLSGMTDTDTRTANIYLNDGEGTFSLQEENEIIGVYLGDSAMTDIDNDGDLDLILTGANIFEEKTCDLYLNNGFGEFEPDENTSMTGVDISTVAAADTDGDENADVVLAGWESENPFNGYVTLLYENISTAVANENIENEDLIRIFPNPAAYRESIQIKTSSSFHGKIRVSVTDCLGKTFFYSDWHDFSMPTNQISVADLALPKGVYIVSVSQNETTFSERIIIR